MEIKDHRLKEGGNVKEFTKTPNHSGEFRAGNLDTIIIHYTAGAATTAIRTLTNPRVKASAHVVLARDGSITQLAPFNIITWHAGRSSYKGRTGFNKYSIGIEIENDGWLKESGSDYISWYGKVRKGNEVMQGLHRNETRKRAWHTYTQEQIETVIELCQLLIDEYDIKHILGHEEIAPRRKFDPGPAFPLDKIRTNLLASSRNEDKSIELPDEMRVAVRALNIRSLPSISGEKIAKPLVRNQKVKILQTKGDWYKVSTEIEGWVSGKYLTND